MKPLLVSTYDMQGGAARAANRLHNGLKSIGICSRMLVQKKQSVDPDVYTCMPELLSTSYHSVRRMIDFMPLVPYRNTIRGTWSTGWFPASTVSRINALNPDVVHLHWVGFGFMPLSSLSRICSPVIWTLHDMWPFTGGCHYPDHLCARYEQCCGVCPLLSSKEAKDLTFKFWGKRQIFLKNSNVTFVSPSRWLANCAEQSSLLSGKRVEVIPNGIDTDLFRPMEKNSARRLLNLPLDKKIVLFGAVDAVHDTRKGFLGLVHALESLYASFGQEKVESVLFGSSHIPKGIGDNLMIRCVGTICDDRRLSALYSSADVFLVPSLQDNLPNTIMEAMACGTPCVAYSSGGIPEMIIHNRSGALCTTNNPNDFAAEIVHLLSDSNLMVAMAKEARKVAVNLYSLEEVSHRYLDLYQDILKNQKAFPELAKV